MKKYLHIFMIFCMCIACIDFVYGQLPGQVPLDPTTIPQFVDPLPHFAGLRVDAKSGGNLTIKAVPHQQVAVSTGTMLDNGEVGTDPGAGVGNYWVYRISNDGGMSFTPPLWPAFTIEASRGNALNVTYINDLVGQTYESVNLIVDQTLHWADPLGDHGSMEPYTGAVPIVAHLHGGEVSSESDGGPDAWFTPDYANMGPAWDEGVDQYYDYPNTQEEATLWFHDHALGATRLNVYAGLAGFYFLRGPEEEASQLPGWSGDDLVQEVAPTGASGTFNPNPYLPEIEIVIQDRMFDSEGGLYFPNEPTSPVEHPFWTPEFIGDVITVNGKTWPFLSVAPRKYRFRMLNGSNSRFYDMTLDDGNLIMGNNIPFIFQIGTDGGLLDKPVQINSQDPTNPLYGGSLLLAPGERADIVIDFSKADPGSVWTLLNSANSPYPDGDVLPDPATTGRIMQFVVNGEMVSSKNMKKKGKDNSKLPGTLRSPMVKLSDFAGGTTVVPDKIRQLTLNEVGNTYDDEPLEALVNNTKWDGNGMGTPGLGETELPVEGETELWQIINLTGDAHPIHMHLVQMQLVGRQMYDEDYFDAYEADFASGDYEPASGPPNDYDVLNADGAVGGNPAISSYLLGNINPPLANEQGWKDTYVMFPGEVTTFVVRYAPTDVPVGAPASALLFPFDPSEGPGYVWHCHIIDHEDNEMMRPYKVTASPERAALAGLKSGEITASKIVNSGLGFRLGQNYPNPFDQQTEIVFHLPEDIHTKLTVYNSLGQEVQTLINEMAPKGRNTVRLDGSNLKNGIYLYKLSAGPNMSVRKFTVNH